MRRKKIKFIFVFILLFCVENVYATYDNSKLSNLYNNIIDNERNIFNMNHPVGSIYETTNVEESTIEKMHDLYGGTWEVYGENKLII